MALVSLQNMELILWLDFQQQLVSYWFAWTVDVDLPAASSGSTQVLGSDKFASRRLLCWTRCSCEICRNEFKGCQCKSPGQFENPSWANYGQPPKISRVAKKTRDMCVSFVFMPSHQKKRGVLTFGEPTQEDLAKLRYIKSQSDITSWYVI